jgi:hypothetical protein
MRQHSDTPLLVAIPVLIIKSPFLILGYLFKHKALLVILVIGIIAFFGLRAIGNAMSPASANQQPIPSYQASAPSIKEAPNVILTSSRVYYVADFKEDNQVVTLNKFYVYNKNWELVTRPLVIDKNLYGGIKLYTR